jgi:FKBP-type peptidyl-prolyl cis-trans isomerase (trigger factor)
MKLQIKHKEISPIQHKLAIQLDWEEVEKRIPDTIKKFRENSTFDGFRKGKAPKKVVVAQIGMKNMINFRFAISRGA